MTVTYEDPAQAEEKRRLLRMLGGGGAEAEVEVEVAGTRRSGVARGVNGVAAQTGDVGRTRRTKRAKVPGF